MSRARILVVEDNELNRQLLREVLTYHGFDVIEASDATEGWSRLEDQRPDLVLLDIQIPGGGGQTLLRAVREDPLLSTLPVVAVTAFAMRGDRERFLGEGFDGYLSKPLDTRTLPAQIASFLEKKGI